MRILVLADIHGNWPALQAVAAEPHDLCICLGDLVDYGLEPVPCIQWVRKHARYVVRGNHDHAVAQDVPAVGQTGFKYLSSVTRPLTKKMVSAEDRKYLAGMPVTLEVTIEDLRYFLVHGTPRDPLEEYAFADPEFWARRLDRVDAEIVCVGHTHMPFLLEVDGKLLINPGSVGLPRDGDPRASYAVVEGRKVEHKRVEYAYDAAVALIQMSELPDQAKKMMLETYTAGEFKGPKTGLGKNQKSDTKVELPKTP
jgi:putative phosphoesterase